MMSARFIAFVALAAAAACGTPARDRVDAGGGSSGIDAGDGLVHCDPGAGSQACYGTEIAPCNADGTVSIDSARDCGTGLTCAAGACVETCTADGVDLVYVVSAEKDFLSFDPRKLPADPFTRIGTLDCTVTRPSLMRPAPPEVLPFSMGVARDGTAWVEYTSGEVFNVSLTDASCVASRYVPEAGGMKLFGMGYVTDDDATTSEKLFLGGGSHNPDPGGNLARVDTQLAQYTPTIVGPIYALSDLTVELTGTNEGRLFGFFPRTQVPSYVQELDKTTGAVLGDPMKISTSSLGPNVRAWAFAQWAGKFYVFVTSNDTMTDNSTVRVVDRATGDYDIALSMLPYNIVGAGVSTCAPSVVP